MFWAGFYPLVGNKGTGSLTWDARSSHSISVEDETVTQKLIHGLALPFHAPRVMSLQSLEWREGVELFWLVISYKPHQCDQNLCNQNANVGSSHPWSLCIKLFTLDPTGCSGEYPKNSTEASCLPNLEESQLSLAGNGVRCSTLVALSQSHSYSGVCSCRVVVAHPAPQPTQPYKEEMSLAGVMRKSQFWWRTHKPPIHWFLHEFWGDAISDIAFHSIWFSSLWLGQALKIEMYPCHRNF